MRLSSPPFTHTALFPAATAVAPLDLGSWIWVRGSGSDSTSQNHPPDPTLPPPSFVAVEAWAFQWTVYVWWPAAGLSNMA